MANVHNVIIRGINSIYLQAPYIKSATESSTTNISDFLFFIKCYCDLVELHHSAEENFLFPSIAKLAAQPDIFTKSVDQHHAFSAGLHRLHEYAITTKADAYSGAKVQEIVDSFAPTLQQHLADEVGELLELKRLDSTALMKIHKDSEKAKEPEVPEEMFPLFFGLVDKTYEGGIHGNFPPVPFFVPWIVHHWHARTHRGVWRFLPCDFWRQPRPLRFTG